MLKLQILVLLNVLFQKTSPPPPPPSLQNNISALMMFTRNRSFSQKIRSGFCLFLLVCIVYIFPCLLCFLGCLCQINVKTAEPIVPTFCVVLGPHMTQVWFINSQNYKKLSPNISDLRKV